MRAASVTLLAAAGVVAAPSLGAPEALRVRSSTLVFEQLRELREALPLWHGDSDLVLEWSAEETEPGFVGLLDGSTDLLVSSRRAEARERALARRLGVQLREDVLALDGVAVVVHRENDVQSLSLSQLRTILSGRVVGWHGVGGKNAAIRVLRPAPSTGIHQVLAGRVLNGSAPAEVGEVVETPSSVLAAVASDRTALGFVSSVNERSAVKTISISVEDGGSAFEPAPGFVESGDYPLSRVIRIHTRSVPDEALRGLIACLLTPDARARIAAAGFVPVLADRLVLRGVPSRIRPGAGPVTRVPFPFRESRLDVEARRTLGELAERIGSEGAEVWVTGHSEPGEAGSDASLAAERARTVETFLRERGVSVAEVEGRGAADPLGSSLTPEKSIESRRVDVWVLAGRRARRAP